MAKSKYQAYETETISRDMIKNAPYNPRIMDPKAKKRLKKNREWDFDKLANMSEEFDLDLSEDLGFTESDIDFMFDGDDRFSQLFNTQESENVRGDLEKVKEARKQGMERVKERGEVNFFVTVVFETEEDRDSFMKEISIPKYEKFITEEQVRRISR